MKGKNGIPKDEVKPIQALLQQNARSKTEEELDINQQALYQSLLWAGDKRSLRYYITSVWMDPAIIKVCYSI